MEKGLDCGRWWYGSAGSKCGLVPRSIRGPLTREGGESADAIGGSADLRYAVVMQERWLNMGSKSEQDPSAYLTLTIFVLCLGESAALLQKVDERISSVVR